MPGTSGELCGLRPLVQYYRVRWAKESNKEGVIFSSMSLFATKVWIVGDWAGSPLRLRIPRPSAHNLVPSLLTVAREYY